MATTRREFVTQTGAIGAVALSAARIDSAAPFLLWAQQPELAPRTPFPVLNRRTRGWLHFLWEKTTTPDDWSSSGTPHPWWDRYSAPGVQSYPRFDLQFSSYALLLMADQTPAWDSAMMMVSEVAGTGAWTRAFEARHADKFTAPTVDGVDFPTLGVYQAWNDPASGTLHVGTYAPIPDRRGRETSWRVTSLPNSADVSILCDGEPFTRFDIVGPDTIRLTTTIDNRYYQIFTNYHRTARAFDRTPESNVSATGGGPSARSASQDMNAVHRTCTNPAASGLPTCPCCA